MEQNRVLIRPLKRSIVTWGFCFGNSVLAVALLLIVFIALPVRWWPVDLSTVAMAMLLGLSAVGLATRTRWQLVLLRVSALVCLVLGLLAIAAACLSAAFLIGTHGDLGKNGVLIMTVVIAILLPYLIIYPCSQLFWIRRLLRDQEAL